MADDIEAQKAIRAAIKQGDLEKVVSLIEADKSRLGMMTVFGTWLHVAADQGQLEIVKRLVAMGADINARGGIGGGTPLFEAVNEGRQEIVKYLLAQGATMDVSDYLTNPLLEAIRSGHSEVAKLLIAAGIDTQKKYIDSADEEFDAITLAKEHRQKEILALLLPPGTAIAEEISLDRVLREMAGRSDLPAPLKTLAQGGFRALFYKKQEGVPSTFAEICRDQRTVILRNGRAKSWGKSETRMEKSVSAASKIAALLAAWFANQGYELALQTAYTPGEIDRAALQAEIREGARQAFEAIQRARPREEVNAFALVSDDSAMTIGCIAKSAESLRAKQEEYRKKGYDAEDCLWNPSEWTIVKGDAFLDVAYRRILAEYHQVADGLMQDDDRFPAYQKGFLAACLGALEELIHEGFFGEREKPSSILVLFHIVDTGQPDRTLIKWCRRLNGKEVAENYAKWIGG